MQYGLPKVAFIPGYAGHRESGASEPMSCGGESELGTDALFPVEYLFMIGCLMISRDLTANKATPPVRVAQNVSSITI